MLNIPDFFGVDHHQKRVFDHVLPCVCLVANFDYHFLNLNKLKAWRLDQNAWHGELS